MKITKDIFDKIPPTDFMFASGIVPNHPDGAYMTNGNIGKLLRWVAIRTYGGGWKLYIHWIENDLLYVRDHGDKVMTKEYIRQTIDVDDEVFALYEK